ncbi:MAG: GNAT family N-acetyltransferase [Oscillospiraceae bacterium]|jgi:predicted acetyltransferase|nr:GNAT family N-acetyltransferase [Oscillospiraceae bacterium]
MARKLVLVKPDMGYAEEIGEYRKETLAGGGAFHGASGLYDYDDPAAWVEHCRLMERRETLPDPDWVTAEQFMLVYEGERRALGMINFRHYFNDYLAEYAGHIGYSVRPSERRKGYAKAMLRLCLDYAGRFGLDKVLITCRDDNEASRRVILSCGGVFERTAVKDDGEVMERYWIAVGPSAATVG